MTADPRAVPAPLAVRLPAAWATALLAFAVSRGIVLLAGAGAHAERGDSPRAAIFDPGSLTRPFGGWRDDLVAPFAAWDSVWYLVIANDAYGGEGPREAFFPLYPLLVGLLGRATGSPLLAGVAIACACAVAALAALHRLAELELGAEAARWTVWAVALCPVSFFLSAVYSESLFLALSTGALLCARTGRWPAAAALGALAAATRSAGIVLLVPLLALWWSSAPRRRADLAWPALVPAGLGAFCAGLWLAGESPWAPFAAQEAWLRAFAGPFVGAGHGVAAALEGRRDDVILLGWLALVLVALAGAWRRLPAWHGAYATAALALPLSWPAEGQPLMSLPRFALVLPPLFLWLGWWLARGQARRVAVLGAGAAGLALLSAQFATWEWVA